jgi:GABA(A) receptor-associated protein
MSLNFFKMTFISRTYDRFTHLLFKSNNENEGVKNKHIPDPSTLLFEKRKRDAMRVSLKHPDMVPIYITKRNGSKLNDLDKAKYLFTANLLVSDVESIVYQRLGLFKYEKVCMYINHHIVDSRLNLENVYKKYKYEDGFIYMEYSLFSEYHSKS